MIKKITLVSAIALLMAGCATSKSIVSKDYTPADGTKISLTLTKDPGVAIRKDQIQQLESRIKQKLAEHGVLAANEKAAQHAVVVNLHSFKMREDAARLLASTSAGCDYINGSVMVTDKATSTEIGKSKVSIKGCASLDVTWQVISKYANGVVDYLTNEKES
jgi:hypothetical protein